jgi:predicted nucleic acid-binding Zn ribbon protein
MLLLYYFIFIFQFLNHWNYTIFHVLIGLIVGMVEVKVEDWSEVKSGGRLEGESVSSGLCHLEKERTNRQRLELLFHPIRIVILISVRVAHRITETCLVIPARED